MKFIKEHPKLVGLVAAMAMAAAGYFGGPVASEAVRVLLQSAFGG